MCNIIVFNILFLRLLRVVIMFTNNDYYYHVGASLALLVNSSLSSEDGCYWAQLVLEEKQQLLYENLSHELQ